LSNQTYDNYYRAYYLKNRKKILARTKEYRRKAARDYYYKKKAERIAAEKAPKAPTEAYAKGELPDTTQQVTPLQNDPKASAKSLDKSRPFNDSLPSPEDYYSTI
jgi:hypothetical protein